MHRVVTAACSNAESVARLLAMVDEMVVVSDLNGRIAGWSRGADSLFEASGKDVLGLDSAEIYAEDERAAHRDLCRLVAAGTSPSSFYGTIRTSTGSLLPVYVEIELMHDDAGAPACLLSTLQVQGVDIPRVPVSGSQLREFSTLIDALPVGIWDIDVNRRFAYSNPAGVELLGDPQADVTGRHIRDVLGESVHHQLLSAMDKVLIGTASVTEVKLQGADGEDRHLVVHLVPKHRSGQRVAGCIAAVLDATTARVAQESQLRREQLLRSTLIREINHRVKNSLQGLIGMMRLHASRNATVREIIEQSVAQLMAVAVAFGLASRHGEAQILLCDLVSDITNNVAQMSHRRINVNLSPAAVREPVVLSERFGANISLVINELVFNAVKHSLPGDGHRNVNVFVDRNQDCAELKVVNESGKLPAGFSLEEGSGLGTGLSLIKVLVPPESGKLSIFQQPEGVCARLELRQPILS